MCTVSYVGDAWSKTVPDRWPNIPPVPIYPIPDISREEFEALKLEIALLKHLLVGAKAYDEATGQPDCEMDEKVELIKRIAEAVGVDLEDVFG